MDVDINAPVSAAQNNTGRLKTIFGDQRAETSDFLGRYQGALGGQEKTGALASRIGQELGLPQLQGNAQMLRDTITFLPQTYGKATRGFDVNANQLQRIIATKAGELAPAVESAERAVSNAQNNLDRRLGYEFRDQDRELSAFDKEQSFLSERLARESSGYTSAMGAELDAIIAKMNAGITISEGEKNRANQLALAEREFENQKKLLAEQAKYKTPDSSYISVGEGNSVFDPKTGKFVATAPKTYKPESGSGSGLGQYLGGSSGYSKYIQNT